MLLIATPRKENPSPSLSLYAHGFIERAAINQK